MGSNENKGSANFPTRIAGEHVGRTCEGHHPPPENKPSCTDLSPVHSIPKTGINMFACTHLRWLHSLDNSVISIRMQVPKGREICPSFYLYSSICYLTQCPVWTQNIVADLTDKKTLSDWRFCLI